MQISRAQYEREQRYVESLEKDLRIKATTLSIMYGILLLVLPIVILVGLRYSQVVWKSDITTEYGVSCVKLFDNLYCD